MANRVSKKYSIILASKSPRRQFLLKEIGIKFSVKTKDTDESFSKKLKGKQIALYLCKKKALAFVDELKQNELLITADTIVCIGKKILNKPANHKEAVGMLTDLAGKMHTVYTGVCFSYFSSTKSKTKKIKHYTFVDSTNVYFNKLSPQEIDQYIRTYKPFDKAGSYGAQDSLPAGMNPCSTAEMHFLKKIRKLPLAKSQILDSPDKNHVVIIKKISGSYFNVMGLPILKLYKELKKL